MFHQLAFGHLPLGELNPIQMIQVKNGKKKNQKFGQQINKYEHVSLVKNFEKKLVSQTKVLRPQEFKNVVQYSVYKILTFTKSKRDYGK